MSSVVIGRVPEALLDYDWVEIHLSRSGFCFPSPAAFKTLVSRRRLMAIAVVGSWELSNKDG